eukprot:8266606-Ditylum_brightwellii.AAC.1
MMGGVVSHQSCPTKDTAGSANTDPQATKNKTLPAKQQQKHNNQLSCSSTGTSRTQFSNRHCHYGNTAPSSDAGVTLLTTKPGNGTNDAG